MGGRLGVPEERCESAGAEELNSSEHIGLETEPTACQESAGEALIAGS